MLLLLLLQVQLPPAQPGCSDISALWRVLLQLGLHLQSAGVSAPQLAVPHGGCGLRRGMTAANRRHMYLISDNNLGTAAP